jgi:hypothetical protein
MDEQHGVKRAAVYVMKTALEERGVMKTEDGLWFKVDPQTQQPTTME